MSSVEEIEGVINWARQFHQVDVRVMSSRGNVTISALRQDTDRFYVAKRNDVSFETMVDEIRNVVNEINVEREHWKLGQPPAS